MSSSAGNPTSGTGGGSAFDSDCPTAGSSGSGPCRGGGVTSVDTEHNFPDGGMDEAYTRNGFTIPADNTNARSADNGNMPLGTPDPYYSDDHIGTDTAGAETTDEEFNAGYGYSIGADAGIDGMNRFDSPTNPGRDTADDRIEYQSPGKVTQPGGTEGQLPNIDGCTVVMDYDTGGGGTGDYGHVTCE